MQGSDNELGLVADLINNADDWQFKLQFLR